MLIEIVGLGYIGLPTALIMAANSDIHIVGVDKNEKLVDSLLKGEIGFEEEGLSELFELAKNNGIKFSTEHVKADICILAVPTPYQKENKQIDASYVIQAVKETSAVCAKDAIIVIESTVSPGTIDKHIRPIIEYVNEKQEKNLRLAHAPERIIPGNMMYELQHNARVIGAYDTDTGNCVKEIYQNFCKGDIVVTDIRTAEMTKVVENTYRDINIAFANELAKICRSDNMDVYEIIHIANMHPRVNILNPGPGVGGHCISVDPWFLVGDYPGLANIILAARKINDSMPEFVLERISVIMREKGITDVSEVGLYGLTYKEDVNDVRESPSLQLLNCMERHLAHGIKVYDPFIKYDIVDEQYHDLMTFIENVRMVVIMVAHTEIKEHMNLLENKVVLDTKHVCSLKQVYYL